MSEDPLIGTVLADRYRVDRLIGEGAMGRVYQAEHILMRKRVALKVLHPELMSIPEVVQRFEREARAAAHMEHRHVAGATDFGKLPNGNIYLILEFIEGVSLAEVIEQGPMDVARVLLIAEQIASALEVAHGRGIVHRDLKPDNLLLVEAEDEDDFIKILDFGIAKVPADASEGGKPITQIGMVYGTPEYMAPEQALGQEVDGRADLYALGVVMYEMLAGRRPYVGPAVGLLGQQLSSPLPKMFSVAKVRIPPPVEELVAELLNPDVRKRVASAKDVLDRLKGLRAADAAGKLSARGGSLLSVSFEDVSTRIEHVTRNIPRPVSRMVKSRLSRAVMLALGFGAVGVILAIFLIGMLVEEAPQVEPVTVELEPPPPVLETPPEAPDIDERLEKARAGGLSALFTLEKEFPREGTIQAEISLELAKSSRYEEAVDYARRALAEDPELNESGKVSGALFRAAQSPKARSAAFRLLEGPMGARGVDIIYDLSRAPEVTSRVKETALEALRKDEVRSLASEALKVTLLLSEKKECEEIRSLLPRTEIVGDERALPLLQSFSETKGCGPRKTEDCYPCLRDEQALEKALSAIQKRAAEAAASTGGPAGAGAGIETAQPPEPSAP